MNTAAFISGSAFTVCAFIIWRIVSDEVRAFRLRRKYEVRNREGRFLQRI